MKTSNHPIKMQYTFSKTVPETTSVPSKMCVACLIIKHANTLKYKWWLRQMAQRWSLCVHLLIQPWKPSNVHIYTCRCWGRVWVYRVQAVRHTFTTYQYNNMHRTCMLSLIHNIMLKLVFNKNICSCCKQIIISKTSLYTKNGCCVFYVILVFN